MKKQRPVFQLEAWGWDREIQNSFLIRRRKYFTQKGVEKAANKIQAEMSRFEPLTIVSFLGYEGALFPQPE